MTVVRKWPALRSRLPTWLRRDRQHAGGDPPIVLFSFNRPHYFRRVLEGLSAHAGLAPERVHLFQDGAVNAYSGRVAATQTDIDACVALFRHYFPRSRIHISPANIGIEEHFLKAERVVFEELGAECAYFFEDDLVPSPRYLEVMDRVYQAVRHEDRIGYFAAYGDHKASPDRQQKTPSALTTLGHHWAFGIKRSHCHAMQPLLEPYYAQIMGCDHTAFPIRAVLEAMQRDGLAPANCGQDNVKAFVTTLLGRTRLNTVACFGHYIGEQGTHFTPKLFTEMGFHGTCQYDGPLPDAFITPTNERIDYYIARMTEIWADAYRSRNR